MCFSVATHFLLQALWHFDTDLSAVFSWKKVDTVVTPGLRAECLMKICQNKKNMAYFIIYDLYLHSSMACCIRRIICVVSNIAKKLNEVQNCAYTLSSKVKKFGLGHWTHFQGNQFICVHRVEKSMIPVHVFTFLGKTPACLFPNLLTRFCV